MYATIDEIKASSKRVPAVIQASPVELRLWMEEAKGIIDSFCSQDFIFEPQTTKRVLMDDSLVILPKTLSGKVTATVEGGDLVPSGDLEHVAGEYMLRYRPLNIVNWSFKTTAPKFLLVTGDWGYPDSQEQLLVSYANELKSKFNSHRTDTGVHHVADGINIINAADATDLSSAITLLNDAMDVINSHFIDVTVHVVADSNSVSVASATNLTTALALAAALDTAWGEHIGNKTSHLVLPNKSYLTTLSTNNPTLPYNIKKAFIRLVQRLALRDDEEDNYIRNSGYTTETTGDNYSYSLADGTLRAVVRPEEFALLWPHQHSGRTVM